MDYRIISIGTLSVNELWKHQGPARTPHATTTLITTTKRRILVDPGLPQQVIAARLAERSGLTPDDITDVFLTNFRPSHRLGLDAFPDARWLISEREREAVGTALVAQFEDAPDDDVRKVLQHEIAILKRCEAAPDKLDDGVDLFPLYGYTPGTCGVLLSHPSRTTLVAGDAVPTLEHLEHGRVLRGSYDIEMAQESLKEAIEIAEVIIPGHDNVCLNPVRRPF